MENLLISLVDQIIDQKVLQFSVEESILHDSLVEEKILVIEHGKILISDYVSIASIFIERFSKSLKIGKRKNFADSLVLMSHVYKEFTPCVHTAAYDNFEIALLKFLITEANHCFGSTFTSYFSTVGEVEISTTQRNFIKSYCEILPSLNLNSKDILDNTIRLIELATLTTIFNDPLFNILTGVRIKCTTNYEVGLMLLEDSMKEEAKFDVVVPVIISGLFEHKRLEFYHTVLLRFINDGRKVDKIISGLASTEIADKEECDLFAGLLASHSNVNFLAISLIPLAFTILRFPNGKQHDSCFSFLKQQIESMDSAESILHNLIYEKIPEKKKLELLMKLVEQQYFNLEKYMKLISNIFHYIAHFESFRTLVLTITDRFPFVNFLSDFNLFLRSVDKLTLDNFLVELLTDNKASRRYIGIQLFSNLSTRVPYHLSVDFSSIEPIAQYKLWVSLTEGTFQPKSRLKALLPLLDSKSQLVKESFLSKLEILSEDFGGGIVEVLKDNLDLSMNHNLQIITRIQTYIDNYYTKNVDVKSVISEFDPYRVNLKLVTKCNEYFHKNFGETMDKSVNENSMISLLGTRSIRLAKGGGWRFGESKEISKLGKIQTSFTMPRGYFINPDIYEIQKGMRSRLDWSDNEFSEIVNFLNNE